MTLQLSLEDIRAINNAAMREFSLPPFSAVAMSGEPREDRRKRRTIDKTINDGVKVLGSSNPPQSRDEAIRRIVGGLIMVLSFLLPPQFRLAIQVAGWLWDHLHGDVQ